MHNELQTRIDKLSDGSVVVVTGANVSIVHDGTEVVDSLPVDTADHDIILDNLPVGFTLEEVDKQVAE